MIYKNRLIKVSDKKSTFLFGVRGSGKTAFLKRRFPTALYIDLLDISTYQSYLSKPSRFYETVNAFKKGGLVIVDEIQKIPELLNEVHRMIEESQRHFILTGSSARKLKAERGVNLLGGRAGRKHFHPFVPEELGEDFNLDEALGYGLLPIIWSSSDKKDKLKDYTNTYLKEEIEAEILTRNMSNFSRFLEVAGLCHGQILNKSNIARDSLNKKHHIDNFFSILKDTMLGFMLPAYQSKLRIKEKKKDKFYLIDPGIARAFKNQFGPVSVEEKGFLLEGLIAQILRAYQDYEELFDSIYYWSPVDAKTTEVDFLLKREKELIAIEVKARDQVSTRDYKGLKTIHELLNVKKRIIVYLGKHIRKTEDGIDIWPFNFFCKNLKEDFNSTVTY